MTRRLSRREAVSWFTAGTGCALVFSTSVRAATSDRTWVIGIMLLGIAVLVLWVWVALVRRPTDTPERSASVADIQRRQVRSHRAGPRTPIEQVVRHPAVELPAVRRVEDATTVELRCGAGRTDLSPTAGEVWPR